MLPSAPKLVACLETNVREGLTVFDVAVEYRRRLRTNNGAERLNREIKRRPRAATRRSAGPRFGSTRCDPEARLGCIQSPQSLRWRLPREHHRRNVERSNDLAVEDLLEGCLHSDRNEICRLFQPGPRCRVSSPTFQ